MEAVEKLTHLGDRLSAVGGCEGAVTARKMCGLAKYRECSELLHGRKFHLKPKWAAYKSYIRPAILYESEAWCMKECWKFDEGQKDP